MVKTIKNLAIGEVVVLIIGLIAFSYLIGSGIPTVKAAGNDCVQIGSGAYWQVISGNRVKCVGNCGEFIGDEYPIYSTSEKAFCNGWLERGGTWQGEICTDCANPSGSEKTVCGRIDPKAKKACPGTPEAAAGIGTPGLGGVTGGSFSSEYLFRTVFGDSYNMADFDLSNYKPGEKDDDDNSDGEKESDASRENLGVIGSLFPGFKLQETLTGRLISNAGSSFALYNIIQFAGTTLGADRGEVHPFAMSFAVAGFAKHLTADLFIGEEAVFSWFLGGGELGAWLTGPTKIFGLSGLSVIYWGVWIATFLATYKDVRYKMASFTCYSWQAPTGGEDCEICNKETFDCSEYRCQSLGEACMLENEGTGEELCVWNNSRDHDPPTITPWEYVLTNGYKYTPNGAASPPNYGVKIVPEGSSSGCIAPFTAIEFGVSLDEGARCKIDPLVKQSFDEMIYFMDRSSTSKLNHTSGVMKFSSSELLESQEEIVLSNGGEYDFYIRCRDANGNMNDANFLVSFCIDEGPDTWDPEIVSTDIPNGMPIGFNISSLDMNVYINEPANCKWSKLDRSYRDMVNNMTCETNIVDQNADTTYTCTTTLDGLKDRVDNDFFFRCKDLAGNTNENSYKFTLVGTEPLLISSTGPTNETIRDSTDLVRVVLEAETAAGHDEGKALCYASSSGDEGTFVQFLDTNSHEHSQELYLASGDYTYYIRCIDLGGNTDNDVIDFSVESDSASPMVVRVFHKGADLKVITNEEASCVYSNDDSLACNYPLEEGEDMASAEDGTEHSTNWNPDKSFYIKCKDDFGNQPNRDQCNLIARPFEI